MSPKLFIAVLEDVFRDLDWEKLVVNINEQKLNHLRYADDVIVISDNAENIQKMLVDLQEKSENVGAQLNKNKTKAMTNET